MVVFFTNTWALLVSTLMPSLLKPSITVSSTETLFAAITLIPCIPEPAPFIERPRRRTALATSAVPGGMFIMNPMVPEATVEANVPVPSMVIDLVIVSVPKPPGSRASISPPVAVCEIAPAKVLHGAVRLHGLASFPTPDTNVRVACARAGDATAITHHAATHTLVNVERACIIIVLSLSKRGIRDRRRRPRILMMQENGGDLPELLLDEHLVGGEDSHANRAQASAVDRETA